MDLEFQKKINVKAIFEILVNYREYNYRLLTNIMNAYNYCYY